MKPNLNTLGPKLYGLTQFSRLGLFSKKFVILDNKKSEREIVDALIKNGFKDKNQIAIRFSAKASDKKAINLPFHLGKFSLKKAAQTIFGEIKKDPQLIPYVHELIIPIATCHLYYDRKTIIIEIWPGIGAFRKKILNLPPDMIEIKEKIKIYRYLKKRKVEDVNSKIYNAQPFKSHYLVRIAQKINNMKSRLDILLNQFNPLLCDFFIETNFQLEFTSIQKIDKFKTKIGLEDKDYYIAKSLKDLEGYDSSKKLFFDIPLSRKGEDWVKVFYLLKNIPVVYTRSLTMHLSIILREFGIEVRRVTINDEYEVKELSVKK